MGNIDITKEELAFIRSLEDFDLTMLLSEINDHGWSQGRRLIVDMKSAGVGAPKH